MYQEGHHVEELNWLHVSGEVWSKPLQNERKVEIQYFFGMIWCEWLAVAVGGGDTRLEKTPSTRQPGMQAKTGNKHVTKT